MTPTSVAVPVSGTGRGTSRGTSGTGAGPGPLRRFGRGRVVALETAVGCAAAGLAYGGVGGYGLTAAGAVAGALALVRWRGRTATGHLVRGLRRDAFALAAQGGRDGAAAPAHAADSGAEFGLAGALLPALEVTEVPDRNGPNIGVLSDGRGFATVLELPSGAYPALPAGLFSRWLAVDPSRPAAVQLLVEQHGLPSWDLHRRFQPTLSYRQLPLARHAVALRSWLVLRYEPWEAPEAAASRGGGVAGARAAVVAATARLRARLAALGTAAEPLNAVSVRGLLRTLGDPDRQGRATEGGWASAGATHSVLTAELGTPDDWRRLLASVADVGVDRVVVGATVSTGTATVGGAGADAEVRCAVRLVSPFAPGLGAERDRLVSGGAVSPLSGHHEAGLLATLPLGCPARSLVETTGFAIGAGER